MLLALAVLAFVAPSEAQAGGYGNYGHGYYGGPRYYGYGNHYPKVVVGIGPVWWGAPYAYGPVVYPFYAPVYVAPVYAAPVYAPPPAVVVERPVYVQRRAAPGAAWYWCESARGYYPDVATCPEPWVPVPPRN